MPEFEGPYPVFAASYKTSTLLQYEMTENFYRDRITKNQQENLTQQQMIANKAVTSPPEPDAVL